MPKKLILDLRLYPALVLSNVPIPPSVNHAYITTSTGKRIMTDETRSYKAYLSTNIEVCINQSSYADKLPYPQHCSMALTVQAHIGRNRDLDNLLKMSIDAFAGVVFHNDAWIDSLTVTRVLLKKGEHPHMTMIFTLHNVNQVNRLFIKFDEVA
jgi:Holliday junction resolvase RusA-like endonuclease